MRKVVIPALIVLVLISGCAQQEQPKEEPSPTTATAEPPRGEDLSEITKNSNAYDGKRITLTGQTFLSQSQPRLLINGMSGVNLEGNLQGLDKGFYTLEGIYDSRTNTLKVEKARRYTIDCNTPVAFGKGVLKELVCVKVEGLIASPPKTILDELNAFISIPNTPIEKLRIYPYVVYNKDGIYLVISDRFSILPAEIIVEYGGVKYRLYFSAGEVQGTLVKTKLADIRERFREKLGEKGFDPLEFKEIVIANSIKPQEPLKVTVQEVNKDPELYAFKRVEIESSYLVTTARVDYGEEEKIKIPFGLGVIADKFTDFYAKNRTLRLKTIDPERKVWQLRKTKIIGTILYPTLEVLKYLDYSKPLSKQQIKEEARPALLVDTLVDDVVQLADISELNRITGKPSKYWDKVVEFEGYALGANIPVVKYAEEALGQDIPVEVNLMAVGIADPEEIKTTLDLQQKTPAIAIIGLNNELIEKTEVITGKYRFKVAVSEMPEELIIHEGLKDYDTAFFLLDKEFLSGIEQLEEALPENLTTTITEPTEVKDSDGDGIPDNIDKCPYLPENFNNYQDDDGCPDVKPVYGGY